ncbi:DUF397 domain-containing protein [Actinosynnema pretiosum]|uniref:DUF397 domain-containing protein n=1 Tax=Actinosynnema pretiosum TaxID=42197 RepID=A0A290ZE40_9PSEU|nr:DUF397 domain-containing protein [Actinosynnema pretiosum]ATE57281.1 DUF397 domain-containing protein [Actinosynnema pretiosum]
MNSKWRKSSRSNAAANCVEVARTPNGVLVRDSKNPNGPVLRFSAAAWGQTLKSTLES